MLSQRPSEELTLLVPHRDELTGVVVESTCNGYWLVDGLWPPWRRQFIAHRLVHMGGRHDSVVASIEETGSA